MYTHGVKSLLSSVQGLGYWCLTPLSTIFHLYIFRSYLLVDETRAPRENHRPAASHQQTLSHNVVSPWAGFKLTTLVVIGTDCIGSCKSNSHTITTMMAPIQYFRIQTRWKFLFFLNHFFKELIIIVTYLHVLFYCL